jgi:hypothetical protein
MSKQDTVKKMEKATGHCDLKKKKKKKTKERVIAIIVPSLINQ